ncbi:MAG: permease-like cell division protein FtsX [bacterium]|nr:permease-like cell division protein FtsX [bacterium]
MGLFKHTWKHVRRSPYQALAAVMIMTLTLFVTSLFLFVAFGSQRILDYFESKPQITIFFKDEVTQNQVDEIKEEVNTTGKVSSLKYVSKEEALNIYREQNKNDPLLLELVTANILPASLEVSTTDARYLSGIAETLKDNQAIEEIIYQKDTVDTLISWTSALRKAGMILVVFLSVISLFIILMVIGIKISTRKAEIEVMRLVGASNFYIGRPFIVEGAFYGLVGAVLASALSFLLIFYATPFLSTFLKGMDFLPLQPLFILKVSGGVALSGLFVGSLGSFLAVWRYL